MRSFWALVAAAFLVCMLASRAALADRVAILPTRGGMDPAARTALDVDLTRALVALRFTVVPETETTAAVTSSVADGVADTSEEYRAVGVATKADWVLVGTVEPAVVSSHVELTASLVPMGRVESVAREVDKARSLEQLQEMLAVLLRPEGIGAGEMPWERTRSPGAKPPPAAAPPPKPAGPPHADAGKSIVHMGYPLGTERVWPPYSTGKRWFVGAGLGASFAAVRPEGAAGGSAAFVGFLRGGLAPTDLGLEVFAEFGGNLAGPQALWAGAGGRWMFSPCLHRDADGVLRGFPFHIGPELTIDAFVRLPPPDVAGAAGVTYSSGGSVHPALGAALDAALSLGPAFALHAELGNLRWIPTDEGTILLLGATAGAVFRF